MNQQKSQVSPMAKAHAVQAQAQVPVKVVKLGPPSPSHFASLAIKLFQVSCVTTLLVPDPLPPIPHPSLTCTCKIPSSLFAIIVARSSLNQLCHYRRFIRIPNSSLHIVPSPEPSVVPPPRQANRYLPRVATWIPPTNCQRNLSRTNGEEEIRSPTWKVGIACAYN